MKRREDTVRYSFRNPYESRSEDQFVSGFNRATAGTIVGGAAGLALTTIDETKINLASGVSVSAGLRPYEGLKLKSGKCEAYLDKQNIDTHLPILKGVSIATEDETLLCRPAHQIVNDPRLKILSTLASQRKLGIIEPVKNSFVAKAEQGAATGAMGFALLPVLGAIALKRFAGSQFKQTLVNSYKRYKNNKPLVAVSGVMAVSGAAGALVGCGPTIKEQVISIKDQVDDKPAEATKIPGQLKFYLPDVTQGAVVKGAELKDSINDILRDVNRGERAWNKIRWNLITDVAKPKVGYEYLYDTDHKYYKTMIETGVLCNTGLSKLILPLLQADVRPNLTLDSGDRQIAGGRNGYFEKHCEPNLTQNYHAKYHFAIGNHDQTISYAVQVKNIDGQIYVTAPDPRSRLKKQDHDSVKGEALKQAIALQGSKIALKVCEIYYKTGIKPNVETHSLDSAAETISRGCAANIYTDHPIFIKGIDLSNGSVLRSYLSKDKSTTTDVLISTSSAGAIKRNTPYSGPEKTGDVVVKYSLSPTSRFVKALVFSWNKDGNTRIFKKNPPKPVEMPKQFKEVINLNPGVF